MGFALQILSPAQRRGRQAGAGELVLRHLQLYLLPEAPPATSLQASVSRASGAAPLWQVPGHQPTAGRKKLCSFGINAWNKVLPRCRFHWGFLHILR